MYITAMPTINPITNELENKKKQEEIRLSKVKEETIRARTNAIMVNIAYGLPLFLLVLYIRIYAYYANGKV